MKWDFRDVLATLNPKPSQERRSKTGNSQSRSFKRTFGDSEFRVLGITESLMAGPMHLKASGFEFRVFRGPEPYRGFRV